LEPFKNTPENNEDVPAFVGEMALQEARKIIREGKIVAIKGLGGFHLVCDATNAVAVNELRARKLRVDKPFAVMMTDVDTVKQHCYLSESEQTYLESPAHPIILLEKKLGSNIDQLVAPKQRTLGVMLPYTPLHILLLQQESEFPGVLVMTSGNLSEEPICTENLAAKSNLVSIADAFLMHNRDILIRTDDSVIQTFRGDQYPVRRSRGYSPYPVKLHRNSPSVLATGGELKNTFCVTRDDYAFLSHHIGDLKNYESLKSFEDGIQHFEQIFRVLPEAIACDRHPDYLSTRFAIERSKKENIKLVSVQHHHAHITSLMTEHGMDGKSPIIGVVFDGTGYGDDGNIWGGEFLIANYLEYQRHSHLKYFPLPGGDAATKHPNRVSLGLLYSLGISWEDATNTSNSICEADRTLVRSLLEKKINTPLTSSVGRLFDAIASLVGLRHSINYEAQAAIELEACIDEGESGTYHFEMENGWIDPKPVIESIMADLNTGLAINRISGKFHNSLAIMVRNVCTEIRNDSGISEVGLSGGVWQNISLLRKSVELLEKDGFRVFLHNKVPTNDGGIALGQAAVCVAQLSQ
jgi:hydrogenase maturation protein HypF